VDDGDVKAEIYDLNGVLLDSFIANLGGEGENAIATFTRSTADIAYILAGGVPGEGVSLDNLVVSVPDTAVPEPSTLGLIGLGLLGLGAMKRRRHRASPEVEQRPWRPTSTSSGLKPSLS